jgi:hypothetical protein
MLPTFYGTDERESFDLLPQDEQERDARVKEAQRIMQAAAGSFIDNCTSSVGQPFANGPSTSCSTAALIGSSSSASNISSVGVLKLNDRQLHDVELLLNGGFAPLTGFMSRADYDRCGCEIHYENIFWIECVDCPIVN